MSLRRVVVAVTAAALAIGTPLAIAANSAGAASTHTSSHAVAHASKARTIATTQGLTMLRLDAGTAKVLSDNHISVAPASEARVVASGIAFPIRGGLLNSKTLAGSITHEGGLTFTAGGKSLTIRDFTIHTKTHRLTGYVDEAKVRINILDLNLSKAKVKLTSKHLVVSNVSATLDKTAASALNSYFGTTLFKGGLAIGTTRTNAQIHIFK